MFAYLSKNDLSYFRPASAFELRLEENRDQLTESQPEGENDFSKYAAEHFRALANEDM
jgi:hypothetical protein